MKVRSTVFSVFSIQNPQKHSAPALDFLFFRKSACRGGYQPPANVANFWAEPYWPGDVTMLRMLHVSTLYRRISLYNVRYCIFAAMRRRYFPDGEITGRLIAVELWCDRPRRSLNFDSLRGAPPYAVRATELPPQKFPCANEVLKDTLY